MFYAYYMELDYLHELLTGLRATVSERIRRNYRSSDDFASEAGVSQSSLSRYLRGERSLSLDNFLRIAFQLELDLSLLFPFSKAGLHVADSNEPAYGQGLRRRRKVTILLSETSTLEIKKDSRRERPILELKIEA